MDRDIVLRNCQFSFGLFYCLREAHMKEVAMLGSGIIIITIIIR
jgi:hypothetical protein